MGRKYLIVLVVICSSMLALAARATSSSSSQVAHDGGSGQNLQLVDTTPAGTKDVAEVNWVQQQEPTSVDPAHSLTQQENPIVGNMCESLIRQTPDGNYQPGLAVAWSNPNPLTWVYKIRQGVKFWDGTPMTASDVAFSLNRNLDPKVGSYWAFYMRNVKSVSVTGPYQVTMKLTHPDYLVNQEMSTAMGAISEKAFVQKAGAKYGTAKVGAMCTGPYKFDSWNAGTSLTLVKNTDYWDKSLQPKVGKITFSWIINESTLTNALLTGAEEGVYQAPVSGVPQLRASSSGKLYLGHSAVMLYLWVLNDTSPLKDPRIRQALSLAIDRNAIASRLFFNTARPGKSFAAGQWWSSGNTQLTNYYNSLPQPTVNLQKAKALVQQAGSPKTTIRLATDSYATYKELTEVVADAAREIGLKVSVRIVPPGGTEEIAFDPKARKTTDGFVQTWYTNIPDPLENLTYFLPGGVYNYSNYNNPQFTKLVNEAVGTANKAKRTKLTIQALKIIDREVPWIPIVETPNRLYMSNKISGAIPTLAYLYRPFAGTLGGK